MIIDEIKNPYNFGGLNLPCIISKADSLMLSQVCRMLKNPSSKEYRHLKYWIGLYTGEYFPDMGVGPHAEMISPYFQHIKALLVGGLILGDIRPEALHSVTAKDLYKGFTTTFPPPKIIFKYNIEWNQVWFRLHHPVLESQARDTLFMIIHNIIPNKERIHRFNMIASPLCTACGVSVDNVHLFCECENVREAWFWLRQRLLGLLPLGGGVISNFEFLNLMYDSSPFDSEILWLIGVYIQLVWNSVVCKKKVLCQNSIQSEVQLKYLDHHEARKPRLGHIPGLF